ncbi:uncharacterized protein METZ01_LOCUS400314, partial [marine metagenome]
SSLTATPNSSPISTWGWKKNRSIC